MKTNSTCPIKLCTTPRKAHQVMCKRHWFLVPTMLRTRIWQLFTHQRGSSAHVRAIREAIDHVNHQLDEQLLTSGNTGNVEA